MSHHTLKTGLAMAIAALSTHAVAGGFAINEQSIAGMGTAFAGRSSSALDASTVFGNPAGMARLQRSEIYAGAAMIFADTDISHVNAKTPAGSTVRGGNKGDMVPITGVPMGYYVNPINDQWAFGLGVYVPFGLSTEYENSFQGRHFADVSEVTVITVQPTISYRFNDQLSVGFGPTLNHISGKLTSVLFTMAGEGEVEVKGDDNALGFNAGVLYEFSPRTRVGLTYHSKVEFKLKGHTKVEAPAATRLSGKYDAKLDLTTPESVDVSITHDLDDRWTVYAGSTWTRWSQFDEIRVRNEMPATLPATLQTIVEDQQWHDTWSHAIGLSYKVNQQWTLRGGIALDQSPITNAHRSPRVPSGDRTILSLGAGWSPSEDWTVDLAYAYLREESVDVNQNNASKGTYQARYQNSAHSLGASLSYRF